MSYQVDLGLAGPNQGGRTLSIAKKTHEPAHM